jgi:acetoin utilization deacetylase AcuC-like enzyme
MNDHVLYYDPRYFCEGFGIDTREKARAVVESLWNDPIPGVQVFTPIPATYDDLLTVHDSRYVEAILTGTPRALADSNGLGVWTADLARSVVWSTGGVVSAVERALKCRTNVGSASSGLHHARYASGQGFCTFNGLVVAAKRALEMGAGRVLILDLDAHCGGGTASLIDGVSGIEQVDVSVSSYDSYSPTENSKLTMSSGKTYLHDVVNSLAEIDRAQSFDVLIYNAGMDPHEDCRIGGVSGITTNTLRQREEIVFQWANENGIPVAYVFAGGYQGGRLTPADVVALHRLTVSAAR